LKLAQPFKAGFAPNPKKTSPAGTTGAGARPQNADGHQKHLSSRRDFGWFNDMNPELKLWAIFNNNQMDLPIGNDTRPPAPVKAPTSPVPAPTG
jgi:hypothetical protein